MGLCRKHKRNGELKTCSWCEDEKIERLESELAGDIEEIKKLRERYKEHEWLWGLACQDKCDGNCNRDEPYERCPECAAGHTLNELGEIRNDAVVAIKKALRDSNI